MSRIVPGIDTLELHLQLLDSDPERYRPRCCSRCQHPVLWGHGAYKRSPDRGVESKQSLNPVRIPRFICAQCRLTCSRLPQCIPPRRWYLWLVQQWVLQQVLNGNSYTSVSRKFPPCRKTVSRWMGWLGERFETFRFHLNTFSPEWMTESTLKGYWLRAWESTPLFALMTTLDHHGVAVP